MTNVARFVGGPLAGQTLGVALWPPPELLAEPGGLYERVRMSALTDEQMESLGEVLIRGAEYEWRPDGDFNDLPAVLRKELGE